MTVVSQPRAALPAWAAAVPVVALFVIGGFFAWGLTRDPAELPSTMIDREMPDFALTRLTPREA